MLLPRMRSPTKLRDRLTANWRAVVLSAAVWHAAAWNFLGSMRLIN
jgi:hypothetical protein